MKLQYTEDKVKTKDNLGMTKILNTVPFFSEGKGCLQGSGGSKN